jgi:hypothetical protein
MVSARFLIIEVALKISLVVAIETKHNNKARNDRIMGSLESQFNRYSYTRALSLGGGMDQVFNFNKIYPTKTPATSPEKASKSRKDTGVPPLGEMVVPR